MSENKRFADFTVKGLVSAPCTPFKENGDVNLDMIGPYVDHLLEFGVPNVFITGSTGEAPGLTMEERKNVVEAWFKHGRGRLSAIIVHIGAGGLRDSQELARHAEKLGADAIGCVSPTYFKPATLEAYVHYMELVAAQAPKTPFFLYDIEEITGLKFNTNEFLHLAKDRIPTLTGLKHTTPNFPFMHSIICDHGDRYQVILGSDEIYLEGLSIGTESTVMCSYYGHILNRMKKAFDAGDIATARKEQGRVVRLGAIRSKYGLWGPAATKLPLKMLGLDMGQARPPLEPYTTQALEGYTKELKEVGYFDWGIKP